MKIPDTVDYDPGAPPRPRRPRSGARNSTTTGIGNGPWATATSANRRCIRWTCIRRRLQRSRPARFPLAVASATMTTHHASTPHLVVDYKRRARHLRRGGPPTKAGETKDGSSPRVQEVGASVPSAKVIHDLPELHHTPSRQGRQRSREMGRRDKATTPTSSRP